MLVCVLESWCLSQRRERSVMVPGIVGHISVLLDDDPLRIPRAAPYFGIDIVLAIAAWRKTTLAILKLTPSNVARQGPAMPGLELRQ